MYGGKKENVALRCRTELIDNVIDKFGLDIEISDVTPEAFTVTAPVAVGGTFLSWVFQYAGSMFILSPVSAQDMYYEMLQTVKNDMEAKEFTEVSEKTWKL